MTKLDRYIAGSLFFAYHAFFIYLSRSKVERPVGQDDENSHNSENYSEILSETNYHKYLEVNPFGFDRQTLENSICNKFIGKTDLDNTTKVKPMVSRWLSNQMLNYCTINIKINRTDLLPPVSHRQAN